MRTLSLLSNVELLDEAQRLAASERTATAALVRCLIEVEDRSLHLAQGCSSMFVYCIDVLHLCEGAAYNRIQAARTARKFPVILDRLDDGSLTLTAVRLLGPHLTTDNCERVDIRGARKEARARRACRLAGPEAGCGDGDSEAPAAINDTCCDRAWRRIDTSCS